MNTQTKWIKVYNEEEEERADVLQPVCEQFFTLLCEKHFEKCNIDSCPLATCCHGRPVGNSGKMSQRPQSDVEGLVWLVWARTKTRGKKQKKTGAVAGLLVDSGKLIKRGSLMWQLMGSKSEVSTQRETGGKSKWKRLEVEKEGEENFIGWRWKSTNVIFIFKNLLFGMLLCFLDD